MNLKVILFIAQILIFGLATYFLIGLIKKELRELKGKKEDDKKGGSEEITEK